MAKKKKDTETEKPKSSGSDFGHEIWGLIFMALGVLVLISLISHFIDRSDNILGEKVFGTWTSSGLIYLFGSIPAFFFPLSVGYIGWLRLRGDSLRFRTFFYWIILTAEICLLLAIHHLPSIVNDTLFFSNENKIGLYIVKAVFGPIFGVYRFGPYFLTILTFVITVLSGLKIPPQRMIGWIKVGALFCAAEFMKIWAHVQKYMEESRARHEAEALAAEKRRAEREAAKKEKEKLKKEEDKKEESKKKEDKKAADKAEKEKAAEASAAAAVATEALKAEPVKIEPESNSAEKIESKSPAPHKDIADVEDQARMQLEKELAAFRAKRNEPIKIMTIETAEVEADDSESEIDASPIQAISGALSGIAIGELGSIVSAQPGAIIGADALVDSDEELEAGFNGDANETDSNTSAEFKPYEIPDASVIPDPPPSTGMIDKDAIERNSYTLEKTLSNFGVEGKVVFVSPGPVVTRYEIELAPGIKVSRVLSLHDDISMAVSGQRIRIEAPIPGKSAVGIELPNPERQIVHFKHILMSDAFKRGKAKLPVIIGTNISGAPYVTDITKMPHVLIAGQTGSGKSVCINSVICSMLMTKKPDELRLIMIDPKKVELAFYEGIPHLLSPVVTESKEAVKALQWGVKEMERRYRMLAKVGARNIDSFNARVETGKLGEILSDDDNKLLPFIVIIVDELADLMMTASKDVEVLIQRIAQLARAVGIHLIVATQRPSVDIITGPIKANLTSRISFRTIQSTDSRTILGHVGAEKLLGMGDMLFLRNGAPEIERFHGAFITEEDVERIVSEIRKQKVDIYRIESFHDEIEDSGTDSAYDDYERDELFEDAARTIVGIGQGSTSLLQRKMKIGYARAGRLMDELERAGFVGPADGSKAREVRVMPDELEELLAALK